MKSKISITEYVLDGKTRFDCHLEHHKFGSEDDAEWDYVWLGEGSTKDEAIKNSIHLLSDLIVDLVKL